MMVSWKTVVPHPATIKYQYFSICEIPNIDVMLELYQAEGCPHCAKVREKMTELGLSYITHNPRLPAKDGSDICNEQTYDELLDGGQDQVPFLVDNLRGESLYESDDIVDYLEKHYG